MKIVSAYKAILLKLKLYSKSDMGFVINTFLIWRILIFFIGICGYYLFLNSPMKEMEFDYGELWNMWARWGGRHYIRHSLGGYSPDQPYTAFFPLYAILMAGVRWVTNFNPVLSGLIVSSASLVIAGYFLIKLAKLDYPEEIARKSFILLLAFPTSIFLASVYTESLFLLWIIGALYFARKNKWHYVFIFGFCASLTRNLGVFLCLPLLMEYYCQYRLKLKKQILAIAGPIVGLVSYMVYLGIKFGDPLKFVTDQKHWGRKIEINVFSSYKKAFVSLLDFTAQRNPLDLLPHPNVMAFFEFGLVTLAIVLTLVAFAQKKFRKSYAILMLVLLLPPIMQNIWNSTNRYMMVLFPMYFLLAIFANRHKYLGDLMLIGFSLSLALHTILFVRYMWAG